jgi:hypothetical protein
METVITRDTDVIREYIAALDARERGVSPFARLAATVKLARLRRELSEAQLETTDEDVAALRRELDERLNRTFARRFESKRWGARVSIFLMLVLGQQLVLALVLLATLLFVKLSSVPAWWNPVLPHEEPVFLYAFIFAFFFVTPMLALGVLFGGRYFRSWRVTIPATLIIFLVSVLGTYLVVRNKPNPIERRSSLTEFADKQMQLSRQTYEQWVEANWLMKDEKFQRDYESYLRKGPGRWITSRFNSDDDAAWSDSLPVMKEYLSSGQDPDSFREWLKYYLDRNRIYSEDRLDQEVEAIMGQPSEGFLQIWQVQPYLKERDERMYRAYLGFINRSMKGWGLLSLALFTILFLIIYLTGPALSAWERLAGRMRARGRRSRQGPFDPDQRDIREAGTPGRVARLRERYYSFPERGEITTPPFFDTPFRMLSRIHRSFVRLAVFTSIFVFGFWALVYAVDLASGNENVPSQVALMRSHLLFGGPGEPGAIESDRLIAEVSADTTDQNLVPVSDSEQALYSLAADLLDRQGVSPERREAILAAIVKEVRLRLDENEYENTKKFKEQGRIIASQRNEIDLLKNLSSQLQQSTASFPDQIADIGSRASAAEARAGEVMGEASAARQKAEGVEKHIDTKMQELEARAARAFEQIGKVEDQASVLATRTEELEKELDRRARQVEARTEELGERTAGLAEREQRLSRLQSVVFSAIQASISADIEDLERRSGSMVQRLFNKNDLRRDAESLRTRIDQLEAELGKIGTEQSKELVNQLGGLKNRLEQIAARLK